MAANLDLTDKFWRKVAIDTPAKCWPWTGAKKPKGYGNVRRNRVYTTAHRVAWELCFGLIAPGMQVQHSCDNPSCCNPHHLMLGTVVSNYIDMLRKGRSFYGTRACGERHGAHKLSSKQVAEIRERYVPRLVKQSDLAKEYGVSQRTISIITRKEGRKNG